MAAGQCLFRRFFRWAKPTPVSAGAGQRDFTEWHLAAREALWLRQAEQPSVRGAHSIQNRLWQWMQGPQNPRSHPAGLDTTCSQ